MAVMTVAAALTAIRASSYHDADTQTTDAQITAKLDQEYKRLHRDLGQLVPTLFEVVSSAAITTTATPSFARPANTERIRKVEILTGGTNQYTPLTVGDPLNYRNSLSLCWYEQAGNIIIGPTAQSVGIYRVTGVAGVVPGYTSLDLIPEGCETILVERCAAWVRQRHDESPAYHLAQADEMWIEQRAYLRKRYGAHAEPGLVRTRY
jgi:hypothetical protein